MFPLSKGVYDTMNVIFKYLVGITTFNVDWGNTVQSILAHVVS